MNRNKQTKADLLRANATLRRTNAALRRTNTNLHTEIEGHFASFKATADENNLLHEQLRKQTANTKREIAKETAELQQQAIIKADAIDGLKDQVEALMERVRDLNRQLLDEKSARKKDSKEADEAVAELGTIKNKLWKELVDLQEEFRTLQAENARIKSLHVSAMEFIGTHIHFLKANVQ